MSSWTRERVLSLAPDASSAKAGEGLASPRKWVSTGKDAGDEGAVWGECQGSGAKPYQVQVDLRGEVAFKCSCPSRKFPCKHGLGLMLQVAAGGVKETPRPGWVEEWLASRVERAAKKAEKAAEPVTAEKQAEREEAAAERREKRLSRVVAGAEELRVWLEDLVRTGLAAAQARGLKHFDDRARRLNDAQAPGAARRVAEMGSASASGEGWQRRLLERAASTYLLAEASGRLATLPQGLREQAELALGLPVAKELLEGLPTVHDVWQVIGREVEVEAGLRAQRTHLWGLNTGRAAMLLDFAYGAAAMDPALPMGTAAPATLAFYPGSAVRAHVRGRDAGVVPLDKLRGPASVGALLEASASVLAEAPWTEEVAAPLCGVRPVCVDGAWWLVDGSGDALRVRGGARAVWTLLACSGGGEVEVGVATDGREARLLGVMSEGEYMDLVQSEAGAEVEATA